MGKLVLLLALCWIPHVAAEQAVAKVLVAKGDVKVNRLPENKIELLRTGMTLFSGEKVFTGKSSFIKIELLTLGKLIVGPESSVVLNQEILNRPAEAVLSWGQVRAKIKKQVSTNSKSKFAVKTRTASFGVRGTDFDVKFDDFKGRSYLYVREGVVAVWEPGESENEAKLYRSGQYYENAKEQEHNSYKSGVGDETEETGWVEQLIDNGERNTKNLLDSRD